MQLLATHEVFVGGKSGAELLQDLLRAGIHLNAAAEQFLNDPSFEQSSPMALVKVAELSVGLLGFNQGATLPAILGAAASFGLMPCHPATGAHLRLLLADQPEGAVGQPVTKGCAPPGSITVISLPLSSDPAFPKGLYLRRIHGSLWLRGYRSDDEHTWAPGDHLVFNLGSGNRIAA